VPGSLTIDDAAAVLAVSRRTVYNWIRAGILATRRVGPSQRVEQESIAHELARIARNGTGRRDKHIGRRKGRR